MRVRRPSVPYHLSVLVKPWHISCRLTPTIFLNGVKTKVEESLHNMCILHRKNTCQRSRDVLHVSVLSLNSLRKVTVHLLNTAHDPAWIPKYILKLLDLPMFFLRPPTYVIHLQTIKQCTACLSLSMSPLYLPFGHNRIVWAIIFTFINTMKIRKMRQKLSLHKPNKSHLYVMGHVSLCPKGTC